ncbi:hypothetical protein [Desulfospira joergensenii]|nr:hypothetical protein [Desulfospira joergensenii]
MPDRTGNRVNLTIKLKSGITVEDFFLAVQQPLNLNVEAVEKA